MATFKLVLYTSKKLKGGKHPVMLRITHDSQLKYIGTGFYAFPNEWDSEGMQFREKEDKEKGYKSYKKNHQLTQPQFDQIKLSLSEKLNEAVEISLQLQKGGKTLNLTQLINKLKKNEKHINFTQLTERVIQENKTAGRIGNAINYRTMLNVIQEFNGKDEIWFDTISYSWLKGFETWHLKKGNTINSLSVYMRAVRAIFNRGIKENIVDSGLYPFGRGKYEISSSPTRKRAISKDAIKAIENVVLPENTSFWHAQNIFLFSFYLRGMNFIDIANLKLKDIVNGRVEYIRIKTMRKNAKSFSIKIIPQVQQILDFYTPGKEPKDYVFPIIFRNDNPERIRMDISNALKNYNKYLNKLGKLAGIETHLSSYTARHSWGSIAKRIGIDIGLISDGYGHSDMHTTQTYLDSIENSEIDKANALITG
jgi:integrase/recombinase XerD